MIKLKELDNLKYFSIRLLICQKLSGSIGDTCMKRSNVCVFVRLCCGTYTSRVDENGKTF